MTVQAAAKYCQVREAPDEVHARIKFQEGDFFKHVDPQGGYDVGFDYT